MGATPGAVDTRSVNATDANVQWKQINTDNDYFYLVNEGTGQKLNAPTNKTVNMVAASTVTNKAQWRWVEQGGGRYFLQSRANGKFLFASGNNIRLKKNTSLDEILWTQTPVDNNLCEGNLAPEIIINEPSGVVSSPVTICADATDGDGNITQVEFFVDGVSVGIDNSAPYCITLTLQAGGYSMVAVATDDCGALTTSTLTNFTVEDSGADYVFINHMASGNRLGAATGSVDTRAASSTSNNVQWEQVEVDGEHFYFINKATGQKLNAPTKRTINMVAGSTTTVSAQWRLVDQGNGQFLIQSREYDKYFHIDADGTSDISLKWNANLSGIVWTISAAFKSVEQVKQKMSNLIVYPNPASNEINISVHNEKNVEYTIINLSGAVIKQGIIYNAITSNIADIANGIYVLKLTTGASVVSQKISIKH